MTVIAVSYVTNFITVGKITKTEIKTVDAMLKNGFGSSEVTDYLKEKGHIILDQEDEGKMLITEMENEKDEKQFVEFYENRKKLLANFSKLLDELLN